MAWRVFYSYSHSDAELRKKLATYLTPLTRQNKIIEWHDQEIKPGADWDTEISAQLESAHLILLLVSEDFLASEYCFGVEVGRALARLKRGDAKVVPILLKPCLWQESRFSELQIIPRDCKAITSWTSREEAFVAVATEIRNLVSEPPPLIAKPIPEHSNADHFDSSLDLVLDQVRSYAHLYERIRQRMRESTDRTHRMEQIFQKMCALATASYPLLEELAHSPSPGERLAAVAILQAFASARYLPLLVKLIGSEKAFVGYHATKALHFAVGALHPRVHSQLLEAIVNAKAALQSASVGFDAGRQAVLRNAEKELRATMDSLAAPAKSGESNDDDK
jgi:hypothetical protein